MSQLYVIADDLTGALDTAVQFVSTGVSTCVLPNPEEDLSALTAAVVVVNLPTRHLSPKAAYDAVYRAAGQAVEAGIPYLFKKTDSVLRGNVGAELAAMLDAAGETRMDFLPAFPALDRATVKGVQRVNGVPIHESVFRLDPFEPINESVVARIVARQTGIPCDGVPAGRKPPTRREKHICIYDASTDGELERAAANAFETGGLRVMAGCAGLAGVLGRVLPLPKEQLPAALPQGKLLVVCGSVNPVARRQVDYAQAHGFARVTLTRAQRTDAAFVTEDFTQGILDRWVENGPLILDISDASAADASQREQVAANLAALIGRLWRRGLRGTVMVTGGDTLQAVLNELRCRRIRPARQMRPGVVLAECQCGDEQISVISKAGGFGGEELLTEIDQELRRSGEA